MAWIAVDKDGTVSVYEDCPVRGDEAWCCSSECYIGCVELPVWAVGKLTGAPMTWVKKECGNG